MADFIETCSTLRAHSIYLRTPERYETQKTIRDKLGGEYVTQLDAERANEKIDAKK